MLWNESRGSLWLRRLKKRASRKDGPGGPGSGLARVPASQGQRGGSLEGAPAFLWEKEPWPGTEARLCRSMSGALKDSSRVP